MYSPIGFWLMRIFLILIALLLPNFSLATPTGVTYRLSLDQFGEIQSDIDGLVGLGIFYEGENGLYFGQSIYSGAIGNAGGVFVGGFEIGKYTGFSNDLFWDASLFIGGGGGASQVPGSGLMLRPQIHVGKSFGTFRLGGGVSWTQISGSPVQSLTYGITLTRNLDLSVVYSPENTTTNGLEIAAMTPIARVYYPQNNLKRDGSTLDPMYLAGAEITFSREGGQESFIQANGLVAGNAEGYADWVLGQRWFYDALPFRLFTEIGAGSAGGGGVDTGGGLIATVGIGARLQIAERFQIEAGLNAISSLNGDFVALSPSLRANIGFGAGTKQRWQLTAGITQQLPNADFFRPGITNNGQPLMLLSTIDLFVADRTYLTGHAYTALDGGTGGYQIGLIGLGYTLPVYDDYKISTEILIGAGGGAGVDTAGGLLGAVDVALDIPLINNVMLTIGAGQVFTLSGNGMRPTTITAGLKIPLWSVH